MSSGALGNALNQVVQNQAAHGAQKDAASGKSKTPFADIDAGKFMNILLTQLEHQDPLKPTDSDKMLEQLSTVRNIQSQVTLQDQLKSLVSQNQIAQAGSLIGNTVQGLDQSGNDISGVVTSVRVVDGKAVLELDTGKNLPIARVTRIARRAKTGKAAAGAAGAS